jgi:hypothetical protein
LRSIVTPAVPLTQQGQSWPARGKTRSPNAGVCRVPPGEHAARPVGEAWAASPRSTLIPGLTRPLLEIGAGAVWQRRPSGFTAALQGRLRAENSAVAGQPTMAAASTRTRGSTHSAKRRPFWCQSQRDEPDPVVIPGDMPITGKGLKRLLPRVTLRTGKPSGSRNCMMPRARSCAGWSIGPKKSSSSTAAARWPSSSPTRRRRHPLGARSCARFGPGRPIGFCFST